MTRSNLQDFQIIQRNSNGYADFHYTGTISPNAAPQDRIVVRIVRETDNLTVLPWKNCTLTDNDGETNWAADLHIPEGGLYRVEATLLPYGSDPDYCRTVNADPDWCTRIDCKYHIGVGDIFVMAGQSNMTGYGRDNAYDPPSLNVHAFTRAGKWAIAVHPLCDSADNIYGYEEYCSAASPALSFAKRLYDSLGIPIGLVPTSVGGTCLSQWDPDENGVCYQRMCAMLRDVGVFRGMIWFQGCSDTTPKCAATYLSRFTRIIGQWRETFGTFPVLTVQLNRGIDIDPDSRKSSRKREYGIIRNAQRLAALTIPDVYVVPSLDLPILDAWHNTASANVTIGERLANTALLCVYHKTGQCAPSVLSVQKQDDTHVKILITPGHSVRAMADIAYGMNVEDVDGIIACLTAIPDSDCLVVETERPFGENAVFHYAWEMKTPAFPARDDYGMPLLACYGVEIQQER